jgi:hypothetical protein
VPLWFRLLFYASLGVAGEVAFTAVCARLGIRLTPDLDDAEARRSWRLKGHSFLWMFPIYGVGLLGFEPVHDMLRTAAWPLRGAVYVAGLYAIEFAAGASLVALTGDHVWRWRGRRAVAGHIHLAMAPLWFLAGLVLEPLHDVLVRGS